MVRTNHSFVSVCTSTAALGSWGAFFILTCTLSSSLSRPVSGDELRCLVQVWQEKLLQQGPRRASPGNGYGQQLIPSLPCKQGHQGLCRPHLPETSPGSQGSWGGVHEHLEQQRWAAFGNLHPTLLCTFVFSPTPLYVNYYYFTLLLSTDYFKFPSLPIDRGSHSMILLFVMATG